MKVIILMTQHWQSGARNETDNRLGGPGHLLAASLQISMGNVTFLEELRLFEELFQSCQFLLGTYCEEDKKLCRPYFLEQMMFKRKKNSAG